MGIVRDILDFGLEIYFYTRPFRVKLSEIKYIAEKENTALVFFHVGFANHSSHVVQISNVELIASNYLELRQASWKQGSDSIHLIYKLSNDDDVLSYIPRDELIQPNLDVLPNQSLGKWFPVLAYCPHKSPYKLPTLLEIRALDFSDPPRTIAKWSKTISLENCTLR